jgi:purine-binding chemotaxis protein CheW
MTASNRVEQRALWLREAFDRSFAEAADVERASHLDFLAIRVAGDPYALRLSEVQSLHADRRLVSAPSRLPELLGISGFRGVLTPVYDLAPLLGYGAELSARWLVVAQSDSPIGFAFGDFDEHLRVTADRVSAPDSDARVAVRGGVRRGVAALPLIHLPSLVEAIAQRIKALGPSQEG